MSSSTGPDVPVSRLLPARADDDVRRGWHPGLSGRGEVREHLAGVGTVPRRCPGLGPAPGRLSRPSENNGVMAALAGLGGLYAFLSLVNAVAIGTAQRKREFAVARVTGASRLAGRLGGRHLESASASAPSG